MISWMQHDITHQLIAWDINALQQVFLADEVETSFKFAAQDLPRCKMKSEFREQLSYIAKEIQERTKN